PAAPPLAVPVAVPPAPEPVKAPEPKAQVEKAQVEKAEVKADAKTPEGRPIEAKTSEVRPPDAPKKPRAPAPLVYAKVSTDPTPTLTARTFLDTLKVADRYAAFAEAGGWERLPDDLIRLKPGERSPAIPSLRHHLTLTGDLPVDAPPSDRLDP
ncbi:murein L,D-transpeptidase, partial [Methylobacterium sp. WL18]